MSNVLPFPPLMVRPFITLVTLTAVPLSPVKTIIVFSDSFCSSSFATILPTILSTYETISRKYLGFFCASLPLSAPLDFASQSLESGVGSNGQ